MKILPNLIPAVKLYLSLKYLNRFKKQIIESRCIETRAERSAILNATSTWGKNIFRIFDAELTVNGRENLPHQGPVVYVANHQGYGDIPACCAALDTIQFGFVAKENLQRVPLGAGFIYRREWINLSNTWLFYLYFVQLRIAKVNPFPPIDETST